ncbi:MAG: glycosyltransferase family 39 protein [Verrucomicrobiota bacterium]|nr:glycosyltransferase family 39 protein [Verrucomicrobiota bacterium]
MPRRISLVILMWAAIYLPWLGTSGLRSEEGHRVLPAVEMLGSGNYLVPHIGGQPYLRKPPLINWLVAASFKISGYQNEWSARFPSIVSVLIVALVFVILTPSILGESGSFVAALGWLTSLGMIEKGRMIEIEAVYVSLFALAFLCWLTWWRTKRSPWLAWFAPWVFLGLGLLAKGPALLLFFYALVTTILLRTKRLREIFCLQHSLGILLMLAIFAGWAIPFSNATRVDQISQTWSNELLNRFTGSEGTFNDWLLNFPLALAYFLPLGLALPFLRFAKMPGEEGEIARGLFFGAAVPFILILMLPGAIQRYVLPTLIPACCLLGLAVKSNSFEWKLPRVVVVAAMLVIFIGAIIIFPWRSATVQKQRPAYDADAAPINEVVRAQEKLYAIDPGYQPLLFYVRAPIVYLARIDQVPPAAHYVIVRQNPPIDAELVLRTKRFRGHELLLYRLNR